MKPSQQFQFSLEAKKISIQPLEQIKAPLESVTRATVTQSIAPNTGEQPVKMSIQGTQTERVTKNSAT
jgi:hypothetical protein